MNPFLERHSDSEHPLLPAVRAAVERGTCIVPDPWERPLNREVVDIFGGRAIHLRRFSTPHAQQLRQGTEALLRAATEHEGRVALWWRFPFPRGREHNFIELVETPAILAAFTTVGKLDVSEQEWAALWGPPEPWPES